MGSSRLEGQSEASGRVALVEVPLGDGVPASTVADHCRMFSAASHAPLPRGRHPTRFRWYGQSHVGCVHLAVVGRRPGKL